MKKISLNFFGEKVEINMPTNLESLKKAISEQFLFSPSDAAELIIGYAKDLGKKIIETEQDFQNFIKEKVFQIDLDINENSRIYKENVIEIENENEKNKKELENLMNNRKKLIEECIQTRSEIIEKNKKSKNQSRITIESRDKDNKDNEIEIRNMSQTHHSKPIFKLSEIDVNDENYYSTALRIEKQKLEEKKRREEINIKILINLEYDLEVARIKSEKKLK